MKYREFILPSQIGKNWEPLGSFGIILENGGNVNKKSYEIKVSKGVGMLLNLFEIDNLLIVREICRINLILIRKERGAIAMTADPTQQEINKRKYPRKPIRANVSYHYMNPRLNRTLTGTGFTLNLSQAGALIRIETYLSPLCEIDLNIEMSDGRLVKTRARVIHCKRVAFNRYDVGLHFLSVKK